MKNSAGAVMGPEAADDREAGSGVAARGRALQNGMRRCGPGAGWGKCVDGDGSSDGEQADACGAESPACAGGEVRQDRISGIHRYSSFDFFGGMPNPPNWGVADLKRGDGHPALAGGTVRAVRVSSGSLRLRSGQALRLRDSLA